jgi:tetratricopeptide (TPR) repeat protein
MEDENKEKDLIFGSYNRKDIRVVQTIQGRLGDQGISLWLDTRELRPGVEWLTAIEAAIRRSRAAVIFKGPEGFGNFQRQEVSALFKLHADKELVVIPALLPGASGKDAGLFLGNIQHVDFRRRNPDPMNELISAVRGYGPPKIYSLQPSSCDPDVAHPLVKWIVNEMDNLKDIDRYGRQYVQAKRWPEALYIYHRLAKLAIGRSNRAYADTFLQIGGVYFLAGQPAIAEKKWEITLRIYQDSFREELGRVRKQLGSIKSQSPTHSPPG